MATPTTLPQALTEIEELRGQVRELLRLLGQEAQRETGAASLSTTEITGLNDPPEISFAPVSFQRKQTEHEQVQTLAELRNVIETIPDIIFKLDLHGNLSGWNKRFEIVTGFVPEELSGRPALSFVPECEHEQTAAAILRAMEEGYAELEGHLLTKDQRAIPYHWTGAALRSNEGRVMGISGVGRDVSETKRIEAELRRQQQSLLAAQALAHVGSWEWDLQSGTMKWSEEQFRIFGYEPKAIPATYETFLAALHPDDHDHVVASISDMLEGKTSLDVECRIVRPDGEIRTIHCRGEVVRAEDGSPVRLSGSALDITDRKRAESALRQSESRFRAMIENSSDIITVLDLDGTIRFESPSFERLLGYAQHEIDGRIAFDFIHPDDLPTVIEKFQRIVQRPGETQTAEFRFRHQDGSWLSLEGVGRATCDSQGGACVIVNSRDITERKRAERSLLQTRDLLTSFVENTPAAVAMLDREFKYVAVSRRWLTDYRLGDEPLVGRRHYDVFPEVQDMNEWQEIHQRCLSGSVERREEDRFVRADGSEDWLRWEVRPWHDVTGEIGGIIMFTEVITERKQAEEALRASEERFAAAVEGSTDVLWDAHRIPGASWHAPETPIWWSPRVRQLLGLEDGESFDTLGQWVARLHPDDMNHVLGRLAAHIEQRVPYDVEYRMRTNRGEYRWLRGRGQATWDEQGEPRRMSGSCQDISDRKQAEQALKTSDEQLRQALLASNTGLWDWNTETGEVSFSKEWKSQLGFSETELPDRFETWETRLHPDDRPRAIAYLQNYLAHPEGEYQLEFRLRHKDETYRWIEARASLIGEPDGRRVRLLGSHTDITARKQMEAKLAEREERLRLFIEHSPVALAMLDREMRYVAVSRRWLTDYRLGEQDLIGRHHYDVFPEILAMPEWQEVHQRCLLGAVERREEDHFVRVDGTEEWTRWEIRPWHDVIGEIGGIIMFTEVITERKRADDALRKSEQRFHFAVEATSDGIWDWDIRTGVVYFSPQWMRLLGYLSDEVVPSTEFFFSVVHPDDRARTAQVLQEHLDGRIPVKQLEIRLRQKSGDYRWYLDRGKVVARDQDGRPLRMVGTITDITERKQVEEALKASEERYACATAVGRVGVWALDVLQGLFNADENLKTLLGYTKEELSTDPLIWLDLVHPDDRATALEAWNQVLQGLVDSYSYEVRMTRKDGSIIWTHVRGHANRNKTGNVVQLIGATVDVTDRKRAEAALRESEERYRTLVDLSPNGVFVYSNQKKVYVNQAACTILGATSPEQLMEGPAVHFSHTDAYEAIHASLVEILATGTPVRRVERIYRKLDGARIIVEVDAGRITWNGEPAIQVIFADITERKRAEETQYEMHLALTNAMPGIARLDSQGRYLSINEMYASGLGYDSSELIGEAWPLTVFPDDRPKAEAAYAAMLQEGKGEFEARALRKDGSTFWKQVLMVKITDSQGRHLGHYCFMRDITKRNQFEAMRARQYEALQANFNMTVALSRAASLEEVYEQGIDGVQRALKVDLASILLFDDDGVMRFKASRGLSKEYMQAVEGHSPWSREAVNPSPICVTDIEEDPSMEEYRETFRAERIRALGFIPLWSSDGLLGKFMLYHHSPHQFTEEEIQVAQTIAGHIAFMIQRKRAETALAWREQELRIVLESLPVGVWFTDAQGKMVLGNPKAREIWAGVTQVSVSHAEQGMQWWEQTGPLAEPHRWAIMRALVEGKAFLNDVLEITCLDGSKKIIRNSAVPVRGTDGDLLGAILLNEDITLLRQAQAALQLTQFSVDQAVEGFFWIGPDGRILEVNDAACRLLEYTRDELMTMTVPDIDPNFPPEAWSAHWAELKKNGSLTFESKPWSKNGRVLDMEVTVNYLRHEGKEYNCAIMRDIGERKRTEAALRDSEERYRALYDETPTMYFTLASDGTVLSVNRYGAEQLGYGVEELVGHSVLGIFHEEDKETVAACLSECLTTPEIIRHWEFRKTRKDGTIIWVRETVHVGNSSIGEPIVLVTCEDITARKRVEEMLRQRERDLRAAVKERERISEDLHDGILQSIFAVGLGLESCRTLVSQLPLPRKKMTAPLMAALNSAIGQLNHVMTDVRNFIAGIESQVLQGGDVGSTLRTMVQAMCASNGTACRVMIEDAAVRELSTEQAYHVMNVMREALSNSLRHSGSGRVSLTFKRLRRSIRLLVTDNGKGFTPDSVRDVGHGLVNMTARARKLGGRVEVRSSPRKGTKVVLDVPRRSADE